CEGLNDEQRDKLRATPGATIAINLVRPTPSDELPMRRIFEDQHGNEVGQFDLWRYGYDTRKRPWYRETMKADRPLVSPPYLAFSIGAPVITVSAPLRGKVPGVIAADLYNATIMLLAAQEDFAQDIRRLQFTGLFLAILATVAFIPVVWIFGSGMSQSLKAITGEAVKLQKLAEPAPAPITSRVREIND